MLAKRLRSFGSHIFFRQKRPASDASTCEEAGHDEAYYVQLGGAAGAELNGGDGANED